MVHVSAMADHKAQEHKLSGPGVGHNSSNRAHSRSVDVSTKYEGHRGCTIKVRECNSATATHACGSIVASR